MPINIKSTMGNTNNKQNKNLSKLNIEQSRYIPQDIAESFGIFMMAFDESHIIFKSCFLSSCNQLKDNIMLPFYYSNPHPYSNARKLQYINYNDFVKSFVKSPDLTTENILEKLNKLELFLFGRLQGDIKKIKTYDEFMHE